MPILAQGLKNETMSNFEKVANKYPDLKKFWDTRKNEANFYAHLNLQGELTEDAIKSILSFMKEIDEKESKEL